MNMRGLISSNNNDALRRQLMDRISTAAQILRRLTDYWNLHKTVDFLGYLTVTFGIVPVATPQFDCIYIAEAEDGDPTQAWIGGLIKQWWVIDDNGMRPIVNPDLPVLPDEPENLRSGFYPKPVIKYYFSNDRITLGESFSPTYICRKTARIVFDKDRVIDFVDCHVVWTSASLARRPL